MFQRTLYRPAGRILSAIQISPTLSGCPRHVRLLSCLTVTINPSRGTHAELKEAAVDTVEKYLKPGASHNENDGLVVLASRSLAAWLEDDNFIARLISSSDVNSKPLALEGPETSAIQQPKIVSVLTAALDEVPNYDSRSDTFCSSEGLSILRGSAGRVLSRLQLAEEDVFPNDTKPSIEFCPPRARFTGPLRVTLPLANTVFTNVKPHSLTESVWETYPNRPPQLQQKVHKTNATVDISAEDMDFKDQSASTVIPSLVPITDPRKIVASLGNILSSVLRDKPGPASEELELILPKIFKLERRINGPLDVWALVLPADYIEKELPVPTRLEHLTSDAAHEQDLAKRTANQMDMLLAGGCQLHKVLSGGGGWGAKKGLLALDPETRFGRSEYEDLDSFINSFHERNSSASSALLPPGSYVQFFIEQAYPTPDLYSDPSAQQHWNPDPDVPKTSPSPITVFGTPAAPTEPFPAAVPVKAWPNLFGGVSSEAFYLASRDPAQADPVVTTKINVPRSYIISTRNQLSTLGSKVQGDLYSRLDEVDERR